jgi:hypothetical protein
VSRAMTSERHMALQRAARAGAHNSAATNASGPLRRVIEETWVPLEGIPGVTLPRLRLECGHLARYPKGPFGADDRIAGARRRCAECGKSA